VLESGAEFVAIDILPDPRIRQQLTAYSSWPTTPQLFVGGELIGGCDIVEELHAQGELEKILGGSADAAS
jgi:monothiol glutaredoxin